MTHSVRTYVVIASALVVMSSTGAKGQGQAREGGQPQGGATIHGDLVKDWTAMKDTIGKIANAMPEDKFGFKPTPAQRSFGEQVMHIAQVNMMLLRTLGAKAAAPQINMNAKTKVEQVKAMTDTFDYGLTVINEFNNQTIQDTVQAMFLGPSTRARILFFVLGHTWDIYGQMAVYLRLNGVTPPASQRP